jgi:hypothetical protein
MGKNIIYCWWKGMKEIKNIEHAIVIMAFFSRGRFRYYTPRDMKIIKMYIMKAHKKPRAARKGKAEQLNKSYR